MAGDIVGFSNAPRELDPTHLFSELNEVFAYFDEIVELCGAQRLKTIGDAYLAVAGLLDGVKEPAAPLLRFASRAISYLRERAEGTTSVL